MPYLKKEFLLTAALIAVSNYSYSQIEPITLDDPVQQAMAPIQAYLNQFKPQATLKPVTNALASCTNAINLRKSPKNR